MTGFMITTFKTLRWAWYIKHSSRLRPLEVGESILRQEERHIIFFQLSNRRAFYQHLGSFGSQWFIKAEKLEFSGWKGHTPEGFGKSREFISFAHLIPLTDEIPELAIELGRRKSIKLPNAVIATTRDEKL